VTENIIADHLSLIGPKSLNRHLPQLRELLFIPTVHVVVLDRLSAVLELPYRHVFLRREVLSSIHVRHSSWKLLRQQSGDVDVVDPEERRGQGRVVEQR